MLAAQFGHIEVVRALLAANADPLIVSHNGATALSVAKALNHTAIAALLETRLAELAAAGSA
jgi:ankyrin repeat protein